MRSLPRNILASFLGRGVTGLMGLVAAPVYLRYLGAEGYGVVGVYITLQGTLVLLDLGMSPAVTRGLAQGVAGDADAIRLRSLVRTLETLYLGVGVLAGCAVLAAAPLIATHWVRPVHLAADEVTLAVRMMAVAILCGWIAPFYAGALSGLHAQLELNAVLAGGAILRWGGAALVLAFGWRTLQAFFLWQVVASAALSLALFRVVWKTMPAPDDPAPFDPGALRGMRRFAAGVSAISMLGIALTQLDKLILSKLVSLSDFGQYTLASQFATVLAFIGVPVFMVVFPHFSTLAAAGERDRLRRHFHGTSQLVAVLMFPWAFTLAFFSADILALWGRGSDVSLATALLPWLVAGTALNILVNPPCLVQMASGHTRAIAVMNGTAVVLFAPVLFALSLWSGAMGAALAWVLLNAGSFLIGVPALMRRTLPRELAHWYGIDIAIPAACALGVGLVARAVAFAGIPLVTALAVVLSVALGTLAAAAAAPATRPWLGHAARWVQARLA